MFQSDVFLQKKAWKKITFSTSTFTTQEHDVSHRSLWSRGMSAYPSFDVSLRIYDCHIVYDSCPRLVRNPGTKWNQHLSTGNRTPLFEVPETHLQGGSRSRPGFQGSQSSDRVEKPTNHLVMHSMQICKNNWLVFTSSHLPPMIQWYLTSGKWWNFNISQLPWRNARFVLLFSWPLLCLVQCSSPWGHAEAQFGEKDIENFPRNKKLLVKNMAFHSIRFWKKCVFGCNPSVWFFYLCAKCFTFPTSWHVRWTGIVRQNICKKTCR